MICIRGATLIGAALLLLNVVTAKAENIKYGGLKYDGPYKTFASKPKWYLRMDGSYSVHNDPEIVEDDRFDLIDSQYDPTWSFGGGIGRYYTKSIRGDITYDYRFSTNINGTVNNGGRGDGFREFGLTSHILLANLYYDFNRDGRINPYVGIGLGTVYHKTKENTLPTNCICDATIDKGDSWNVAGAFLAGAALNLHDRINLDFGYRFLYLGEVQTGSVNFATSSPTANVASDITAQDLYAHEIRFGLRYNIN